MAFLYIFLVIIMVILFALCLPVTVVTDYSKKFRFEIRYLFFHFSIYPPKPIKEKKPKKKKPPKEKKEKPEPEPAPEKEAKPNLIQTFFANQGFDGVVQLIRDAASSLSRATKGILHHLMINELYVRLIVAGQDAAQCAIKYGRVGSLVFPALGLICSKAKVKRYDAEIQPDFLATFSEAEFFVRISIRPIFVIGAGIALVFRLLFKVVLKLLFSKPKRGEKKAEHQDNPQMKIKQGGAVE